MLWEQGRITRLIILTLSRKLNKCCCKSIGGKPVSYTHLDVYKRQHVLQLKGVNYYSNVTVFTGALFGPFKNHQIFGVENIFCQHQNRPIRILCTLPTGGSNLNV